jgi:hypothetical protein
MSSVSLLHLQPPAAAGVTDAAGQQQDQDDDQQDGEHGRGVPTGSRAHTGLVVRCTQPRRLKSLALAALCLTVASCGGGGASDPPAGTSSDATSGAAAAPVQIVALGDSQTTGHGDPTRVRWVGRRARLLTSKVGLQVQTSNLARDGTTSADLLSDLRSDATIRAAVKRAEIVLSGSPVPTSTPEMTSSGPRQVHAFVLVVKPGVGEGRPRPT